MSVGSSAVKATAKAALKGNWPRACVACIVLLQSAFIGLLIAEIVNYVGGSIAAVVFLAVLAVFLFCPLLLGVVRFFWRLIFDAFDSPVSVFYYFSSRKLYRRALSLTLAIGLRAVLYGVLLYLPAAVVHIFSSPGIYDLLNISIPLWTGNLYYLALFLQTVAGVILFFLMLKFYMAPFFAVADEEMTIGEAVHMSVIVSRGSLLDFVYLLFSFAGWILLSLIVLPLLFTLPYFVTAFSVHIRYAVAEYNRKIEKMGGGIPTFVAGV